MAKGVLKLKKYLILAVVTLLAVALSACSGNVKSNDTSAENTTTQVSTSVNETAQTSNAELPKIYNPTNVEIRDNEDENKVIIESSQIEYVCLLDDINGMVLNMKLTADGTDKFADYTKNNIVNCCKIFADYLCGFKTYVTDSECKNKSEKFIFF